jgi:hypothetical protein
VLAGRAPDGGRAQRRRPGTGPRASFRRPARRGGRRCSRYARSRADRLLQGRRHRRRGSVIRAISNAVRESPSNVAAHAGTGEAWVTARYMARGVLTFRGPGVARPVTVHQEAHRRVRRAGVNTVRARAGHRGVPALARARASRPGPPGRKHARAAGPAIVSQQRAAPVSGAPDIVVHQDHDDDWKRIGLIDDYGQKIELSLVQLNRLAEIVKSDEFPLITWFLVLPRARSSWISSQMLS